MTKKIPLRKCLATGVMYPKSALLRIVKNNSGEISIDLSGRAHGRGAYVFPSIEAIEMLIKNRQLEKAFSVKIEPSLYEQLRKHVR